MVCLGNICRSPLAQGVMEHKLAMRGIENWKVDSAGTGNYHIGQGPDQRSVSIAKQFGLDISHQKARQVSHDDFKQFDVIIAMDQHNKSDLLKFEAGDGKAKIYSFMELAYGDQSGIVPDPYFDNRFEHVYQILDEAMDVVIDKITEI